MAAVRTARERARAELTREIKDAARRQLAAVGADGLSLRAVARELGMDRETLKTHLRRIRAKYTEVGRPAPTRRDLYVRAVEDGLVPAPAQHDPARGGGPAAP